MRICLAGQCHVLALLGHRDFEERMRIHLADARTVTRTLMMELMGGHAYRLVSYHYLKNMRDPKRVMQATVADPERLIVDSGIFSFMFGSEQGKLPATYDAYRDYTRKYLDDMADWGVDAYLVEVDAHRILGMEPTMRLREEFKPLGSRCMYVWHQPEGLDGLEKLAKEVDYLGIGLPELRVIAGGNTVGQRGIVDRMCMDLLRRVHTACGDRPPRIHLLGCTVQSLMETRLAWSCDSTSWLSGIRFGNGCMWTPQGGILSVGVRSARFRKFREQAADAYPLAADFARKQDNPDYYLNCLACAYAYSLYQKWLDSRYSPVPMRGDALPGGPM